MLFLVCGVSEIYRPHKVYGTTKWIYIEMHVIVVAGMLKDPLPIFLTNKSQRSLHDWRTEVAERGDRFNYGFLTISKKFYSMLIGE